MTSRLSWLRLLVSGTVEADTEAGRVALAAGWAARTRRRDTVALVPEHAASLEARLDRTWSDWRAAQDALLAEALPPTVRGWRELQDRARRAVPRSLPSQLNGHTAAAWLRGDAKAALGPAERGVIAPAVVTHDNLLRLRPHSGLILERGSACLEGDVLRSFTGEIVIPDRAFVDGLRFSGRSPDVLLLVENVGVYVDIALPESWCGASLPGWNLAMLRTLRDAWPSVPAVLFGDLDPAGVMIAATCRREWPGLGWFVPDWDPMLLRLSQEREWPALADGLPETIVRLAEAGRWIEQERLLHLEGLAEAIRASARG